MFAKATNQGVAVCEEIPVDDPDGWLPLIESEPPEGGIALAQYVLVDDHYEIEWAQVGGVPPVEEQVHDWQTLEQVMGGAGYWEQYGPGTFENLIKPIIVGSFTQVEEANWGEVRFGPFEHLPNILWGVIEAAGEAFSRLLVLTDEPGGALQAGIPGDGGWLNLGNLGTTETLHFGIPNQIYHFRGALDQASCDLSVDYDDETFGYFAELWLTQDATGGRKVTFGAGETWQFFTSDGLAPQPDPYPGATTLWHLFKRAGAWCVLPATQGNPNRVTVSNAVPPQLKLTNPVPGQQVRADCDAPLGSVGDWRWYRNGQRRWVLRMDIDPEDAPNVGSPFRLRGVLDNNSLGPPLISAYREGRLVLGDAGTQLGFFGAASVVRPGAIPDADGTLADVNAKLNQVLAALHALGLIA